MAQVWIGQAVDFYRALERRIDSAALRKAKLLRVTRDRVQAWLGVAMLAALAWACVIWLTDGFVLQTSLVRLSSREPLRPLVLATLFGVACWYIAPRRAALAVARVVRSQSPRLVYCVAATGAGLLVFQWLASRPLWLDEEMIALNLRDRTIVELAQPLSLAQSGPFGWLALQQMALRTLGPDELALRLVPMLFGVGVMGISVWVGRRWMGSLGAVTIALCCALGQWITFYSLELKHYSADVFWAFLLPALAAWSTDAPTDTSTNHRTGLTSRVLLWWTMAAIGLWFGNGALFVTPGCAMVLLYVCWRRGGQRLAWRCCLFGVLWVLSFAADYFLTLRPALDNNFLAGFWAFALPPRLAGLPGTLRWLAAQFQPLAIKPGGVHGWVAFWLVVAAGLGLLIRAEPIAGLMFVTVPLSAAVLASLRLVPLYERLSLWIVPSLYVGLAYFVEASGNMAAAASNSPRRWARLVAAGALVLVGVAVVGDVGLRGVEDIRGNRPRTSHHQLDDRAAVRALMQAYEPGDVLMTTKLGLPALWWYAGIPAARPGLNGSRQPDGSPILRVDYMPPGPGCAHDDVRAALEDRRRVLVYFGFRVDDVPQGFDELLLDRLRELGRITFDRAFADNGRAVVVDLRARPGLRSDRPSGKDVGAATIPRRPGCLGLGPIGEQ